jgi:glycosyltransferase involved in cell wall biosynthesis
MSSCPSIITPVSERGQTELRLTFVITGFGDGGAQRQCALLANELAGRNSVAVQVVYFLDGVNRALLLPDDKQIDHIATNSLYRVSPAIKAARQIKEFRPHAVFTWLHAADIYGYLIRALVPGAKWILAERDSKYPTQLKYFVRRVLGAGADMVIANSAAGAQYWRSKPHPKKIRVAPNIVPLSLHSPTRSVREARIFTYIGRLEEQKNVETLCHAMCALAKARDSVVCNIVGAGSLHSRLQEIITTNGVSDRVLLHGYSRDVPAIIDKSDVMISISHHEGTPNVALESIRAGRTLALSDIPEHTALVGEDYPYLIRERNDARAVARKLAEIADRGPIPLPMRAHQLIQSMSPSQVADKYLSFFYEIVSLQSAQSCNPTSFSHPSHGSPRH